MLHSESLCVSVNSVALRIFQCFFQCRHLPNLLYVLIINLVRISLFVFEFRRAPNLISVPTRWISSLLFSVRCTPSLSLVRKLSLRSESVSVSLSLFALRISYRFFEFVCTPTLFIFYNFISLRISCFFI